MRILTGFSGSVGGQERLGSLEGRRSRAYALGRATCCTHLVCAAGCKTSQNQPTCPRLQTTPGDEDNLTPWVGFTVDASPILPA